MTTNDTNTNIFDSFEEEDHDDADTPRLKSPAINDDISSIKLKAFNLLVIGIILMTLVVAIDCFIRTYLVCKLRKQKRSVTPSPEEMIAT